MKRKSGKRKKTNRNEEGKETFEYQTKEEERRPSFIIFNIIINNKCNNRLARHAISILCVSLLRLAEKKSFYFFSLVANLPLDLRKNYSELHFISDCVCVREVACNVSSLSNSTDSLSPNEKYQRKIKETMDFVIDVKIFSLHDFGWCAREYKDRS